MTGPREENAQHFQAPKTDTMVSRNGRNGASHGPQDAAGDV